MDQALQPHKLLAVNSNPFPLMLQLQAEGNEGNEGKGDVCRQVRDKQLVVLCRKQ